MLNLYRLTTDHFVEQLKKAYYRTYSEMQFEIGNVIGWTARLVSENIANTDALYHNLEHTILVTMAGQAILEGKHLSEGEISPEDWLHFSIALLCHDIGYVRGVLEKDNGVLFASGVGDEMVELPDGGTDIALTPYHVDRSKMFVRERFGKKLLQNFGSVIDVERIASYIEMTRFPPPDDEAYQDTSGLAGLTRAADFIGQLGDPNYLIKTPALFYEFQETNSNESLGYKVPADLRRGYATFFWNVVNPYITDALKYLRMTQDGKQWIANLYAHVFTSEHQES